jgi:hypothetical protein
MAKSRTSAAKPATTLDQVRSLLTSAEQKILHSSMGAAIAKASKEQVEAAMARARVLRDKWRDLHESQTRSTKRSTKAGTGVNQRTKAKHDVFDGAVKRFEARLAEFAAGVRAVVGGKAARLTAAAKPTKAARTKAARGSRASVRSELKEATAEINRGKKLKNKKVKAAARAVAAPAAPAAVVVVPTERTTSKKRKKSLAPKAAVAQKRFGFDATQQRSAKASAKAARLKFDGATTRRAGNALASTKRAQARRDGKRR